MCAWGSERQSHRDLLANDPVQAPADAGGPVPAFRHAGCRHGPYRYEDLEPVLKHIVWSCNNAYEGVYPACDSSGRPLTGRKLAKAGTRMADDRRYACAELKGDWKWHERWLRLQATPVCRQCCYLCGAQAADTRMRYYAIGDNPPWASTEVSTPGFIMNKVRPGILSFLSMS